ncbi:MAG: glycosyltransferase [Alphaproteobacteria bacterium]|nr:glycosyltransferase [Alphaproteobacteria bacterium]
MPDGNKGRLLFISPVMPATGGNGLAMRAGNLVEALSAAWEVHVAVLAVGGVAGRTLEPALSSLVADCRELAYPEFLDPAYTAAVVLPSGAKQQAALRALGRPRQVAYRVDTAPDAVFDLFGDRGIDAVFVLRQYMAPLAARFLGVPNAPMSFLDSDDDDVEARRRFAALLRAYGNLEYATLEELTARQYATWEEEWMPRFDMIFAASPVDALRISGRNPEVFVDVLPNVVRSPARVSETGRSSPGRTVLMVGNLSYLPNVDGALWLGRSVAPLLRADSADPLQIVIAGSGPDESVMAMSDLPGITVIADPPDVAPLYMEAAVAAVPVRAGGGTRIKILEAFAQGVPVVSTTLGAEGLSVEHDRHLLIADTPEDFAAACRRLVGDQDLRARLVAEAQSLQRESYSLEALTARFSAEV